MLCRPPGHPPQSVRPDNPIVWETGRGMASRSARRRAGSRVAMGRFGAMMEVDLINDGPVTLILERSA